ncbi:glycosyltransferase [Fibrobacter sp.]|uniref:glycosyltransferase n=1 Tax=Fibrobacter sp. TaxID=35828 RepID=UPI003868FE30
MAKIGIVLATYNGEKYLAQMLDSLMAQTRQADFIVAVDDGSKDSTPGILESYRERLPLQVTRLEKNSGHRAAFSKALELAKPQLEDNDLIALADQDDVWLPQKLEILEKAMETGNGEKPALVFGDAQVINASGKTIAESWRNISNIPTELTTEARIAGTNNVTGCLSLFRASLLKYVLPIPPAVGVHDAWIGLLAAQHGKVTALKEPVILYRLHDENSVGLGTPFSFDETCRRQIAWTDMLLEKSGLLNLSSAQLKFLKKLNHYWHRRSKFPILLTSTVFLIRSRKHLFSHSERRFKKVLFSILGSPAVHLLFGKDK